MGNLGKGNLDLGGNDFLDKSNLDLSLGGGKVDSLGLEGDLVNGKGNNLDKDNLKVYGYCRVSTKTQARDGNSFEDQAMKILSVYPNAELVKESCSAADSVKVNGFKGRRMFVWLLSEMKAGDTLVVTKLDRFCRSAKEGLEYLEILDAAGVNVHILNMGLIDGSPMGMMVVTMMLAFAEFERSLILERTQAGKAIAREKPGYREGRPEKVSREEVKRVRDSGMSVKEGCEMLGISRSTWYAKLADAKLSEV